MRKNVRADHHKGGEGPTRRKLHSAAVPRAPDPRAGQLGIAQPNMGFTDRHLYTRGRLVKG